jgi:AcrR family transcriptional regulator
MKRKNVTTQMMKEYIAKSLLLLMAEKAYADISIGEIADRAGVNRSTYYRNFASKDAIVEFWFSEIMIEYMDKYRNLPGSSAEDYLSAIFHCFYSRKNEFLLIHGSGLSHLVLSVLNRIFEETAEAGGRMELAERYRRYFHTGGIYNFLSLWLSRGMDEPPEAMIPIAISCFSGEAVPMLLAEPGLGTGKKGARQSLNGRISHHSISLSSTIESSSRTMSRALANLTRLLP